MPRNDTLQSKNLDPHGDKQAGRESHNKMRKVCSIPGFGIICALISSMLYASNILLAKMINLHPLQLAMFRVYNQFWLLLPFMFYKRSEIDILGHEGVRLFVWLHGFISVSGMLFLYLSLDYMAVGNSVTITYLSMIMAPFFARIFLKESLVVLDLVFAVVSLIGVVFIAQPAFLFSAQQAHRAISGLGVMYAVISAATQALNLVTVRKLGAHVHLSVFYFSLCGCLVLTLLFFALQEFRLPCQQELPMIFLLGLTGLLAVYFLTLALRYERTGTIAVLRSIQIILVYALQVAVLGDIPNMLDLIGASLVLSCSLGIGVRKIVTEKKKGKNVVTPPVES